MVYQEKFAADRAGRMDHNFDRDKWYSMLNSGRFGKLVCFYDERLK